MSKNRNEILKSIFALQDLEYKELEAKLAPNLKPDCFIGVRTPELKRLAKTLRAEGEADSFIRVLPHRYFEENQLHAFIISEERDFRRAVELTDAFLPYIDNWATCDQTIPRAFRSHPDELRAEAERWISSEHTYTIRFGIGVLMRHFLDGDFSPDYPALVASVQSEEYYVKMMVAWYFATALAKQYDAVLPYIEQHRLEPWTHNKAIQKAIESYRVPGDRKEYLRTLKFRKK